MSVVGETITGECPTCGTVAERTVYDIGSGPELSCSNCEWCWGADGQDLQQLTPAFVCPTCGRASYHPEDAKQGYCGACHAFTGTPK